MNMTTTRTPPFASAQEFIDESGFGVWLERATFEGRIRYALGQAGFSRSRMEHVPVHKLTIAVGRSMNELDFRPMRRIRADIRRAFQREGLNAIPSMVTVYRAGSRMLAHVGVFEAES